MIEIKSIYKTYKLKVYRGLIKKYLNVKALDDFSLTINDGEIVALVGRSGCGKSVRGDTQAFGRQEQRLGLGLDGGVLPAEQDGRKLDPAPLSRQQDRKIGRAHV